MKIVIELADEIYEMKKSGIIEENINEIISAVIFGKPLPKGHGRLIDADELLSKEKPNGITDDVWRESHVYKMLTNASTIIEADKGGER